MADAAPPSSALISAVDLQLSLDVAEVLDGVDP